MSMPSNSSKTMGCGNPTTTECVFWQGDNIECLGIERGQTISTSVKLVADKVCELQTTLDLSDLDLKCIFDFCLSCPQPEKTLGVVLQLIINKVCNIQELIENITSATGSESSLIRVASCFRELNLDGDLILDLPIEEYVRKIANEVCQIKLTLSELSNDIVDVRSNLDNLTDRVQTLENTTGDEVSSDCLFNGTREISDAWDLLDQAFCQTRTALGLTTDINLAISQQCEGLNAEFASNPAWIVSPSNLAQSLNNLWIVLCKRGGEIKTIQDNCCAVTCDDVRVGFVVAFEDGLEVVRLRFTNGSGTNIPNGFTDFGSLLTVTDESGNSVSVNISISNNGEEVINLLGLNSADKLTFNIEARLQNGTLRCEKCVNKVVDATNACSFCTLTNLGQSDATIIYETQSYI